MNPRAFQSNRLVGQSRQRLWPLLPLTLLLPTTRPAAAQYYGRYATDTTQLFNHMDQMPTLPDGGDNVALNKHEKGDPPQKVAFLSCIGNTLVCNTVPGIS